MTAPLTITVTQEHIDDGETGNPGMCPIALAIRDTGVDHTLVDSIYIEAGDRWYEPTQKARQFMRRFDKRKPVKPTTFRFFEVGP